MEVGHLHELQIVMDAAAGAVAPTGFVAWEDVPLAPVVGQPNFPTLGVSDFAANGTTPVTIMQPAPSGYMRRVTNLQITNGDNQTRTLSVLRTLASNTSNNSTFYKASMLTLANWVYTKGIGWKNQSAAGLSL